MQHGSPVYNVQNQERIDGHMKALKLQQYLWEAKTREWENSPVRNEMCYLICILSHHMHNIYIIYKNTRLFQ